MDFSLEIHIFFSSKKNVNLKREICIYSKDFRPATEIEMNLFNEVWRLMDESARKGFARSEAADPDDDFRAAILRNNVVSSAFKVHRMQNDMARRLLDSAQLGH